MNFVDFRVSGYNVDLLDISKNLNISPKYMYKQGEECLYRGEKIKYKEDCWIAHLDIEDPTETEEKLAEWINFFHERIDYILELSNKHDVSLWITLYPETNQYHLLFSIETINKLSELNICVGIPICNFKNFIKLEHITCIEPISNPAMPQKQSINRGEYLEK